MTGVTDAAWKRMQVAMLKARAPQARWMLSACSPRAAWRPNLGSGCGSSSAVGQHGLEGCHPEAAEGFLEPALWLVAISSIRWPYQLVQISWPVVQGGPFPAAHIMAGAQTTQVAY